MTSPRRRLESKDIPQADSLDNVRRIVEAVAEGAKNKAEVAELTGINPRHVLYGLHTARVLGFLIEESSGGFGTTDAGNALRAIEAGSTAELDAFRKAISESEIVNEIAPELLSSKPPTHDAITQKIVKSTDLSESTAVRRAQTLISWRTQLTSTQTLLRTTVPDEAPEETDAEESA